VAEARGFSSWSPATVNVGMQLNGYWTPELHIKDLADLDDFRYTWFPNTRGDRMMGVTGWVMPIPKGAKHVKESV